MYSLWPCTLSAQIKINKDAVAMETTKKLFDPNSTVCINFNPVAPLHHDLHMLQLLTHFLQNERSGSLRRVHFYSRCPHIIIIDLHHDVNNKLKPLYTSPNLKDLSEDRTHTITSLVWCSTSWTTDPLGARWWYTSANSWCPLTLHINFVEQSWVTMSDF